MATLRGAKEVFQSLIQLEDDQIEMVMDAVKQYCEDRQIEIDSGQGLHAMNVAVNIVCSQRIHNLLAELHAQLDTPTPPDAA